jgi:hypothetical protein
MDDRSALIARIQRAAAEGRISDVDRDLRIQNVRSAGSPAELELMARDLDLLETTIAPSGAGYASPATTIEAASGSQVRKLVPVLIVVLVLAVLGAGAGALLVFSSSSSPSATRLGDPVPLTAQVSPSASPTTDPSPATPAYSLSADGVRRFMATYRQRFGTTRTVSATFYGEYVVVQVPVAGSKRHSGWVYRQSSGFTDFGGTTANFPGSAAVDLTKLDIAALFANVSRAKRVLHVADANQTYVIIDYRPQLDPAPNVNIYLTNKFNESGYLATRLNGQVERAYPYSAQ